MLISKVWNYIQWMCVHCSRNRPPGTTNVWFSGIKLLSHVVVPLQRAEVFVWRISCVQYECTVWLQDFKRGSDTFATKRHHSKMMIKLGSDVQNVLKNLGFGLKLGMAWGSSSRPSSTINTWSMWQIRTKIADLRLWNPRRRSWWSTALWHLKNWQWCWSRKGLVATIC
jgi:hypothetical protein